MIRIRAHQVAVLTAAVTLALLLLGNVVWGTGSSLACPDWPTCYGSLFPEMSGGVLYEHSHRLLGATVGILTITLAVLLHIERAPRKLRVAGFWAIAVVVIQGVLGGLTVLLHLSALASVAHLAVAMAFFSLLMWIGWSGRAERALLEPPGIAGKLVVVAYVATYLQIVLGGVVRHTGSAAACTDLPLCLGRVWPAGAHPTALIHTSHRLAALVVSAMVLVAAFAVLRSNASSSAARALAGASVFLIVAQITLGVYVVITGLDIAVVTAHLGIGALLLGNLLLLRLALARSITGDQRLAAPATQSAAAD